MLEVEISKELFEKIRNMKEDDFNRFLYESIASMNRYFEMNDKEALLRKKEELEEKIKRMKEELDELTEFCNKAERDQKMMERWIDELSTENKALLMEMRGNGSSVESRKIKKEEI